VPAVPSAIRSAPPWLLALVTCPQLDCGGKLARRAGGALGCRRCGMLYPVLGGVPVLVAEPHAYCAGYRESIVTALAEHGALDRATLSTIDGFAAAAPGAEPLRFVDDWTAEGGLSRWPADGHREAARFRRFALAAGSFEDRLARLAPDRLGVAIELGCGDGGVARRLVGRARRLVLADRSLRAVLMAREACGGSDRAAGCVLDADRLAVAPAAFDTVLCLNLIDLLERPLALPGAIAAALRPDGHLVLSTPDPELGGDDPGPLLAAIDRSGLAVEAALDQIPWLRLHPPRYAQVYFCLAVVATRRNRSARRATAKPARSRA
jgi:SAM-dependent methyltransferase/uncharacterized protein YbaR (Trm112 family)